MKKKSHSNVWLGLCLAVAYSAFMPFCHADTYTWKGGSGNWSDSTKWTGGVAGGYPGHTSDDIAKIPVNTEPITITVDVTTVVTQLLFSEDSQMVSKPVTLDGDGSLTLTTGSATRNGASFSLQANRMCALKTHVDIKIAYLVGGSSLVVEDDGNLCHRSAIYVYGSMTVNGGNIDSTSKTSCATTIYDGGRLVQNGGYMYSRLNVKDGGSFLLNGGTFYNRYRDGSTINEGARFTLNGGTFRQGGSWTTNCIDWASRLYPVKKGSTLDVMYYYNSAVGSTKYFNPLGQVNCDYMNAGFEIAPVFTNDYPFAGTLMCTNSVLDARFPEFMLNSAKATIGRSGGTLICNSIGISNETSEVDFRLSKIVLNYGFTIYNDGSQINFPNGIEFGAFGGDWNMSSRARKDVDRPAAVNLYGECVVDTTDYLDGETGRNIKLYNLCVGRNRTSLAVKGRGLASLYLGSTVYDSFRRIEVRENATLELSRHSDITSPHVITANELVLGENSTLKINAARGRIDAVRTQIDPTARIHVTIYESQSAARKLLVASLGAVEGEINESNFVIENKGQINWRLVRSGNTFYITDGSDARPPATPEDGRSRWLGTNGGNWSAADNWDKIAEWGKNYSTSIYADFYDSSNWCVTNDIDDLNVRLLYFQKAKADKNADDCGPYILSGKGITIIAGNSVYNTGTLSFPVIINNHLTATSFFNSNSSSDNSITLAGGVLVPAKHYISLNGDWRLGGNVTTPAFVPGLRSDEDARPNKFTILANAKVTVSGQGTTTNNYAASVRYNIENTGLLEFTGGTSLDFPASFESAYHTVHGTLDIGIPLKFGVDQHFHGAGDIKVHSTADFAGSKARVHLSGGITLKPAAWSTATAADGVTAITVDGVATIEPTANLTYGASSDAVTSTAAERALEISDAGDLTLIANEGRTVTFADPVLGEGRFTICGPGTVSFAGGVSVGELAFTGKPKVEVGGDGIIMSTSAVSLDGVEVVSPSALKFADWTTVVSAPEITGTPTVPSNMKVSLIAEDGRMELMLKAHPGFVFVIQ